LRDEGVVVSEQMVLAVTAGSDLSLADIHHLVRMVGVRWP
jgi:hypothetical protein